MDHFAWHRLWSKWDEVIGEDCAEDLMELLRPAYESIIARQSEGEVAPDPVLETSPSEDRARHRLWRKLEAKLGLKEAATMIELWDEAGRLKRRSHLAGVA